MDMNDFQKIIKQFLTKCWVQLLAKNDIYIHRFNNFLGTSHGDEPDRTN